jgi:upstream activation factor subunit UAF30
MARTNKPKTSEQTTMSAPAPVEQKETTTTTLSLEVPSTNDIKPKAKKSRVKVASSGAEEVQSSSSSAPSLPVQEEPVENTVVEEAVVVCDNEVSLVAQSDEFFSKIQQIGVLISSLKSEFRVLEKKWSRELKVAQKHNSRRKRKSGNRAPSGFVKPTKISDELANFLGKDKGTEMARTAVTRDINTYIRTNQLQDKGNGRKINPDEKLASLLKLSTTDELTYFNLQKYMSPHFHKNVKVDSVDQTQQSVSL